MPKKKPKKTLDIMTVKHLAYCLNISETELREVSEIPDTLYLYWHKRKKNGGCREISAAMGRLKRIQKAIHKALMTVKVPSCAHSGVKKRSNVTNASIHAGNPYIYNLDLKDFFPSISNFRVYHLFRHELNCSPEVASILTKLCTIRHQVPQGGNMSMDIANLVFRKMDKRLEKLSNKFRIKYTRYCDDMTFSGKHIPESFKAKVKEIIGRSCFKLNKDKEFVRGKHQPQLVTGLLINENIPRVPRQIKKQLQKEKYIYKKHEFGELSENQRLKRQMQIEGKTNYIKYVENVMHDSVSSC